MTDKVEIKQIDKEEDTITKFKNLYSEVNSLFNVHVCDFSCINGEAMNYRAKFFSLMSKADAAKREFGNIKCVNYDDISTEVKRHYKKMKFIYYMSDIIYQYIMNDFIRPDINHSSKMTHICTIMCYLKMIMKYDFGTTEDNLNMYLLQIQGILSLYIKNSIVVDEIRNTLVNIITE